ncbi:MAG: hypothetical protein AAFV53_16550 [Myxococcota bacterium]
MITVDDTQLRARLRKLRVRLRVYPTTAARHALASILDEVSDTVPSESGRLSGSYAQGARLSRSGGGQGDDAAVEVGSGRATFYSGVEYADEVERGTADTPPGNHVAIAVANARPKMQPGGVFYEALMERIQAAWENSQ